MVGAKWLFLIYFGYHSPENIPFASIFGVAGQNVRLRGDLL
jgi:hypothetical protein